MPHVLGYVHTVVSTILTDDAGLQYLSIVIVCGKPDLALQYHESLGFGWMVMYWYLRARFQTIQETMAFLLQALMKVIVHPQPW
jgi:hypothetical protein